MREYMIYDVTKVNGFFLGRSVWALLTVFRLFFLFVWIVYTYTAVRYVPRSLWVAVIIQKNEIENIIRKGNEWTMTVTAASRLKALFVSDCFPFVFTNYITGSILYLLRWREISWSLSDSDYIYKNFKMCL